MSFGSVGLINYGYVNGVVIWDAGRLGIFDAWKGPCYGNYIGTPPSELILEIDDIQIASNDNIFVFGPFSNTGNSFGYACAKYWFFNDFTGQYCTHWDSDFGHLGI